MHIDSPLIPGDLHNEHNMTQIYGDYIPQAQNEAQLAWLGPQERKINMVFFSLKKLEVSMAPSLSLPSWVPEELVWEGELG